MCVFGEYCNLIPHPKFYKENSEIFTLESANENNYFDDNKKKNDQADIN